MSKHTRLISALAITALSTGCASVTDYNIYAETQQIIARERSSAEQARYRALEQIALKGDTAAQVAAVITLNNTQTNTQAQMIAAPQSGSDTVLKWLSLIVPSAVQIYGIGKNTDVAIVNSNNNRAVAETTTRSMVDMGKLIADREVPVIGGAEDRLLYPEPTAANPNYSQ